MSIIKTINLSYAFGSHYCFKELNFEIKNGENLAILGLNGTGKSTLLKVLMGIYKDFGGQIKINSKFSYLPQSSYLAFSYSVFETVLMGSNLKFYQTPSTSHKAKAINLLDIFGISHLKNAKFNELSGGQRQLVLFARALMKDSKILFLDEPTSALDLKNQNEILKIINSLDKSVVFSTHSPNHALFCAQKVLILYKDLSYKFGNCDEVLNEENLQKLYNVSIKMVKFQNQTQFLALFG